MRYILFFLVLLFSNMLCGQSLVEKIFSPSEAELANPERGWYHHTEVHSGNYSFLNENTLRNYREQEAITLILRVFYLEDFVSTPISQSYLNNMHKDFNTIRSAGVKVIVRFAYSQGTSAPYGDAEPEIVFTHIKQIKELFQVHSDVVAAVQTGFVGTWGEWYYTDHFAGFSPGAVDDENWADRTTVVDELLDALPSDRMIQLRTPGYKMRIFDSETPLNAENGFSETSSARVGHHNDCFVASSSDFGTYVRPEIEKPYLAEETNFTVMGGETCALAPPYSDCEHAMSELERFHWSYLNIDYNKNVLSKWKEQGCYDSVVERLGYRFSIEKASLVDKTNPLSAMLLKLTLHNSGFANLYNERYAHFTLRNLSTDETYSLVHSEDVRTWPLQESFEVEIEAGFPEDIVEGDYEVFLSFPDISPRLSNNPAYALQLANEDIYDSESGLHSLNLNITISSDVESEVYSGDDYFISSEASKAEIAGPKEIFVSSGIESNIIFWGRDSSNRSRTILRSQNAQDYSTIAIIRGTEDFYKDVQIEIGTEYQYKYFLSNETIRTEDSDVIGVNTTEDIAEFPSVKIDGSDIEWTSVTPIASHLTTTFESHVMRAFFDADSLYFYVNGHVENFSIFLNTDNDMNTGLVSSVSTNGADYNIKEDSIFMYRDGGWEFMALAKITSVEEGVEIGLSSNTLENLENSTIIPVTAFLNAGVIILSNSSFKPAIIIRNLPPDLPKDFEVTNSDAFPNSRLEIRWESCESCDSYLLERSVDGENFEVLKQLVRSKKFYYDDFLVNGVYYYRIQSINNIGSSRFSDVKSGEIGTSSVFNPAANVEDLSFSPNPTSGFIDFEDELEVLMIFDLSGRRMKLYYSVKSINVSELQPGLYILKSGNKTSKFIKLNQE